MGLGRDKGKAEGVIITDRIGRYRIGSDCYHITTCHICGNGRRELKATILGEKVRPAVVELRTYGIQTQFQKEAE